MRKLIMPEQSWAAEDAQDTEAPSEPDPTWVDPEWISLSYARI